MGTWLPITGIPEPPWGITQEVTDLSGETYDYGSGPEPYREGPNGPYTHFIDPTDPNATDTDNPYGTVDIPRVTQPSMRNPPAGSIFEFHNMIIGGERFEGKGTFAKPTYIRGFNAEVNVRWDLECDYHIFEGLKHDRLGANSECVIISDRYPTQERQYIAFRNCEYTGIDPTASSGRVALYSRKVAAGALSTHHLVITNCHFHHNGHLNQGDRDIQGIGFQGYFHDVWIVDCHFHDQGGDGIQFNSDEADESLDKPTRMYIGRNVFHDCYENAVDLKMCQDVIISRNLCYDFGLDYAANAKGNNSPMRFGLGDVEPPSWVRNNIWVLFNEFYRCGAEDGVILGFSQPPREQPADQMYAIGNIIHDCHITEAKAATGFGIWEQGRWYFVDNTIYNCDQGANIYLRTADVNSSCWFHNNIFGDSHAASNDPYNVALWAEGGSFAQLYGNNNLLYRSAGNALVKWTDGGGWTYSTLSDFQTLKPDTLPESIESDPLHVDAPGGDFALQSDSPCINAGLIPDVYAIFEQRYGLSIREDFDGNPIPSGPTHDIGAHEYETAKVDHRVFKSRIIR